MYYTLEKTAEILEMSTGDVNRLREQGKLRAFRDGSNWKFRKEDVEKYLMDLIRQRSKKSAPADDLLNDSDDELPTALADSSDFDSMIDKTSESLVVANGVDDEGGADPALPTDDDGLALADDESDFSLDTDSTDVGADDGLTLAKEDGSDGLTLAKEDDGLTLAKEDDGLTLAKEDDGLTLAKEDDGLTLAKEDDGDDAQTLTLDASSDSTDDASDFALADETTDDLKLADEPADSVDLAQDAEPSNNALDGTSDDDLLHLGSDSGLSLLDDVGPLDGSGVSLGDEGDVVLGGSGSGSGSGLNLGSDSGLSLLDEAADDFTLDESSTTGGDSSSVEASSEESDGVFALADEPQDVLQLQPNASEESATLLNTTGGENDLLAGFDSQKSGSESMSQSIEIADDESTSDIFTVEDDKDDTSALFTTAADSASATIETSSDSADLGDLGALPDDASSPFDLPSDGGASAFGGFDSSADSGFVSSDAFGSSTGDSNDSFSTVAGGDEPTGGSVSPVRETEYTGKDFLFLVPCLIFLLLATIGAYELVRTIWSYENGSFDLAGPVLDAIAKMLKLV